ncbi:hypothetical protein A3849_13665 [Paenibacillus sp. P46E]|nr:hypothetical protein A3849_13665 [Paenibacillus sp. P46E]
MIAKRDSVEQLDLFGGADLSPPAARQQAVKRPVEPVLNGFYYERSTDMFVSFVQGRRHYEMPARGCEHLKEWQNRIKKERPI